MRGGFITIVLRSLACASSASGKKWATSRRSRTWYQPINLEDGSADLRAGMFFSACNGFASLPRCVVAWHTWSWFWFTPWGRGIVGLYGRGLQLQGEGSEDDKGQDDEGQEDRRTKG